MNDIHKKAIVYIAMYIMIFSSFVVLAHGTAVSITISGNNASVANTNKTCYGCNNSINVVAWNTSYTKTWMVNSRNNSLDTLSFNISNVTAHQVQQLTVNGTVVNAYQAGANGMLNFTYITNESNKTYTLAPAQNMNGVNMTWLWLWNPNIKGLKNVTANRAVTTVYQNNNTWKKVNVLWDASSDNYVNMLADVVNPPVVAPSNYYVYGTSRNFNLILLVPPRYYYNVDADGTGTVKLWLEEDYT